jgi:hypothetical protein
LSNINATLVSQKEIKSDLLYHHEPNNTPAGNFQKCKNLIKQVNQITPDGINTAISNLVIPQFNIILPIYYDTGELATQCKKKIIESPQIPFKTLNSLELMYNRGVFVAEATVVLSEMN